MKILIIDNDVVTANLLKSRLLPLGHIVETTERTEKTEKIVSDGWDVIFFDPSPITTLKPIALNFRHINQRGVFMILMSQTLGFQDALVSGFNDFMPKPVDMNGMLDKIENAHRLMSLQKHLCNEKEDFPSAGGVIAKSAFNQLFLSSMDRADRYGEVSHIIFITIDNYTQIISEAGAYDAKIVSAKTAHHLVRLRRQSDIIAQIKENEYALLLLRPMTESEPVEAAHRFAESLSKCTDLPYDAQKPINICVFLMRLPTGEIGVKHRMAVYQKQA
ncbi:MAG: diguanylate cyclase [Alphaproteobacteria bacterium]|nr:diguanylate cyclase [Alphaproteobacteria bacterium]